MRIFIAMITAALIAAVSQAAILVDDGSTAWSDTSEVGGLSWSDQSGGSTSSSGADHSITAGDPGVTPYEDLFFQGAGGNLLVDLENYLFVYGTFSASHTPEEVSYYINDGTYSWYYDLPGTPGTTYASLTSSLWYSPDGGAPADPDWGVGTANITEIGIRIWYDYSSGGDQTYGMSDLTLNDEIPPHIAAMIPEPGSFIVLSTALMSLGFTYARRKKEQKAA